MSIKDDFILKKDDKRIINSIVFIKKSIKIKKIQLPKKI